MPTQVHALREVSVKKVIVFVHKTTDTVRHLDEKGHKLSRWQFKATLDWLLVDYFEFHF